MNLTGAVTGGAIQRVVVLADDLTGACASASRYVAAGTSAIVTSVVPSSWDEQVTVVDLGTRALSAKEAQRTVRRLVAQLPSDALVVKRMDTTLRGHLAAEMAALRDSMESRFRTHRILVAPAYPSAGRVTIDGRQRSLTSDAAARDDLGAPLREALNLSGAVLDLDVETVRSGHADEILSNSSAMNIVADARTEQDLAALADAVAHSAGAPWIVVDSGPFGAMLAAEAGLIRRAAPVLIVRGSTAEVTQRQVEAVLETLGGVRVALNPDNPAETAAALDDALDQPTQVVVLEPPAGDVSDGQRIATALAVAVKHVIDTGSIDRLLATGGHTAAAILAHLDVQQLMPHGEPFALGAINIVPHGPRAGLVVMTKGGRVGESHTLIDAVGLLRSADPCRLTVSTHTPSSTDRSQLVNPRSGAPHARPTPSTRTHPR